MAPPQLFPARALALVAAALTACTLADIPAAPPDARVDVTSGDLAGDASDVREAATPAPDCAPQTIDPDASASCGARADCLSCVHDGLCGWCGASGRCMAFNPTSAGPTGDACCASGWTRGRNACPGPDGRPWEVYCAGFTECGACTRRDVPRGEGCGWCNPTGRCLFGTDSMAIGRSCSLDDWTWLPTSCR